MMVSLYAPGQVVVKDATTAFNLIERGPGYITWEISDTITDTENDTIIFNCSKGARLIQIAMFCEELTGTLDITLQAFPSPDGVLIDYNNIIQIFSNATNTNYDAEINGIDGQWAWTYTDGESTLVGGHIVPSNLPDGRVAIVIDGDDTQSAIYRIRYREFPL